MKNYDVFISYSHEDTLLVLKILSELKLNGCKFWYDEHLSIASEFTEEIAAKIKTCPIFLCFFSADYRNSRYCRDEWDYAVRRDRKIVLIRLDNTPLSDGMDMRSGRSLHLIYEDTVVFWERLLSMEGVCTAARQIINLQNYGNRYTTVMHNLANWLISLPQHWSTYDTGTITQNANTCEGLLAMKCIGYDLRKKTIYQNVLNRLVDSATERGLTSKSLHAETVVCTSMMLFLVALENQVDDKTKMGTFFQTAEYLWNMRNEAAGWGVYCERTEEKFCCTVNTCWALIALSQYPAIADTAEYKMFCRQMFELDSDGLFGFYIGGKPKLIATAMYLCLLHMLTDSEQAEIRKIFDYQKAVDFVFDCFIMKNIQVESEELYGIDKDNSGITKVPWNHITCAAALTVLAKAYQDGVVSESKWIKVLQYLDDLILVDTVSPTYSKQFYVPNGIDIPRVGIFTFPTAYLLWGLQKIQNAIDYRQTSLKEQQK